MSLREPTLRPLLGRLLGALLLLALAGCEPIEPIPEPTVDGDAAPEVVLPEEDGDAASEASAGPGSEEASEAVDAAEDEGADANEAASDGGLPDLAPPQSGVVVLQESSLRGLAVFMTDVVRPHLAVIVQSARLHQELEADGERLDDQEWLAKAVNTAEAANQVGKTIETGLRGGSWPDDMQETVDDVRARVAVPLVGGSTAFLAAASSGDEPRAVEGLGAMAQGVEALGAVLNDYTAELLEQEQGGPSADE